MTQIFLVRDRDGKSVESFTYKPLAKRLRDELNRNNPGHVVSRGPDHWKEKVVSWK